MRAADLRRRCRPGGPLPRATARPTVQARRVQALPGRPLEPGLHERLDGVGGDRAPRLPGQLPAGSRLLPGEAALAGPRYSSATVNLASSLDGSSVGRRHSPRRSTFDSKPFWSTALNWTPSPATSAPSARCSTERQGARLPQWLDTVRQDDLPSLHTLAAGIGRDRDAVIAGLTLPWSSGVVEGHVNRIKMLKRQMFGRAGFHLLRKRVLLYP
ncbi:transposase [Streptomyces sp. NPDC057592]|uniref:transposase n=1 Tax=unclassified Streptomyces TaxID=2593676 RepID=UPI00367B0CF1